MTSLEARGISVARGGRVILKRVSMEIRRSQLCVIAGPTAAARAPCCGRSAVSGQ
jgi:ABC-type transporter Mla maintaining outer membrane lipid asymmetry ATPase subunit MlaF